MKERASSAKKGRTYDADGYIQRAGCVCFKTDSEKEVLLVTSNRFPDKWIVPAGGVEAGEEYQDAAVREVLEETELWDRFPYWCEKDHGFRDYCALKQTMEVHSLKSVTWLIKAGVQGKIVRSLGMFQNDISRTRTMLYVLIVNEELEVWQDSAQVGRERGWFPIHKAWTLLSHRPHQQSYLHHVVNSKSKSDQLRPIQQSYWTSQNRQQNRVLDL